MEQIIMDGICTVSFYIAGTVGLLVAGEFIYKFYELASPVINKKVSGLFSSAYSRRRQRPFSGCSCQTFSIRLRG